ncbi:unnamed protein product, partial [Brugia timori]|uniref:7TM_GPCR_Srx domain-containing protein n=1 Tax=Brugia timori TaxID=42155 RepID=A0A0R3QXR5_9BILA
MNLLLSSSFEIKLSVLNYNLVFNILSHFIALINGSYIILLSKNFL